MEKGKYFDDFELWCEECVKISDKITGRDVAFRLNGAQRRVAGVMEEMRRAGKPVRLILLKARQWGGSTLIEAYMAWMQLVRKEGWHSLICAHVKDAAAGLKGMYSHLLGCYPAAMLKGDERDWRFVPYEKSSWINMIPARGCRVGVTSAIAANSLRSASYYMAHLSEVAFWEDAVAEDVMRTVGGTVPRVADTVVVMESTANGRGNYFHEEWLRAERGESDKRSVFVPWFEIEIYEREVAREERDEVLASLDDYERSMMQREGLRIGQIAWYHDKRREYSTHEAMMAEFPSTADEAFATTGRSVFGLDERPVRIDYDREKCELGILIPGDESHEHYFGLFGLLKGVSVCVAEERSRERMGRFMAQCAAVCGRRGARMMIGEFERESGVSHTRWCKRKGDALGVEWHYDEDERVATHFDCVRLCELIEEHRELLEAGRAGEGDPDSSDEDYSAFRLDAAENYPGIAARMLASEQLCGASGRIVSQEGRWATDESASEGSFAERRTMWMESS